MEQINQILESGNVQSFMFHAGHEKPAQHLRNVTQNVPQVPGIYLVFYEGEVFNEADYLKYFVNGITLTLAYFGIAKGGDGPSYKTNQGLKGRINNVVENNIQRAKYWDLRMSENNIQTFYVFYLAIDLPKEIEDNIYDELDEQNLIYPFLNQKRGRPNGN